MRRILMSTIVVLSGATLALAPAAAEPNYGEPDVGWQSKVPVDTTDGDTPETNSEDIGTTANPTAEPEKGKLVEDPPTTP